MAKILVFQHVAHEPLGILDPMLREAKHRIRYVNFFRDPDIKPSLEGYKGLIILGGPMNVDEIEKYPHLKTEIECIKQAIEMDIPILGICLGAQLIAHALGSDVYLADEFEVGWYPLKRNKEGRSDPIVQHFSDEEMIFQWHARTYDTPAKAVNLISSNICPNQAFRYGDKVYGFQFHLEVTEPVIYRWLHLPEHEEDLNMCTKHESLEQEQAETERHLPNSIQLARRVFGEFITLLPKVETKTLLSSRG